MIRFAFRNLLRNKKRSFTTGLSIFFATFISIFIIAYMNGALTSIENNFIKYQTGNYKITTKEYVKRERFIPVDTYIEDSEKLFDKILNIKGIDSVEKRIKFGTILSNKEKNITTLGYGVDLQHTQFDVKKKIIKGKLKKSGLYIGKNLAKRLNVDLGDKLLIVTKTSEGGLNGMKFKIEGIFSYKIPMFDDKIFFISTIDAQKLLKIGKGISELLIFNKPGSKIDEKLQLYPLIPHNLLLRNTRQQIGSLYDTLKIEQYIMWFIVALILFLASFVVINTLMQAIFERMQEIGTLKSLGMTDNQIFLNFTLEGGLLGIIFGFFGAISGYILVLIVAKNGISFKEAMQGVDFPMEYIIRPFVSYTGVIIVFVFASIIPALTAMIPAKYAKKLTAAQALRQ
ncbi:ABC transporter permease [bacterium]|nr:ABC transporter permease [bacterium]